MRECVGRRHRGEFGSRASAEGPAGGSEPDACRVAGILAEVALEDRRVLRVDREQLTGLRKARDELAADNERLLVREREGLVGGQGRNGSAQAGSTHQRVEYEVGIGAGCQIDDGLERRTRLG